MASSVLSTVEIKAETMESLKERIEAILGVRVNELERSVIDFVYGVLSRVKNFDLNEEELLESTFRISLNAVAIHHFELKDNDEPTQCIWLRRPCIELILFVKLTRRMGYEAKTLNKMLCLNNSVSVESIMAPVRTTRPAESIYLIANPLRSPGKNSKATYKCFSYADTRRIGSPLGFSRHGLAIAMILRAVDSDHIIKFFGINESNYICYLKRFNDGAMFKSTTYIHPEVDYFRHCKVLYERIIAEGESFDFYMTRQDAAYIHLLFERMSDRPDSEVVSFVKECLPLSEEFILSCKSDDFYLRNFYSFESNENYENIFNDSLPKHFDRESGLFGFLSKFVDGGFPVDKGWSEFIAIADAAISCVEFEALPAEE